MRAVRRVCLLSVDAHCTDALYVRALHLRTVRDSCGCACWVMQNATAGGDKKNAAPHNLEFSDGFFSSLMMIILSELGDKTFFIAAVREKTCACGVCVCVCVCV